MLKQLVMLNTYLKFSAKVPSPVSWNNIEQKIKDTFVDTLFQGNVTASEMVAIIAKNGSKQMLSHQ
jgi:hypothetical protein